VLVKNFLSIVVAVTMLLIMPIGMSAAVAISLIRVMVIAILVAIPPALVISPTVVVVIPVPVRPVRVLIRRMVIVSADPAVVRPIGSPISLDPVSLWVGGNWADLIPQRGRRRADINVNLSARG
jgi:hypothetical protein